MPKQRERISTALDALTKGLFPFVEREMKSVYSDRWLDAASGSFRGDRKSGNGNAIRWDAHSILTVMWDQWNRVFRHRLGQLDRSLVSELRDFRNRWAHQADFDFDDTYRLLDSAERLLRSVQAEQAGPIAREKRELLRDQFSREAREAYRKSRITKRKLQDLAIYLVCCVSLVFVVLHYFGNEAWLITGFVVFGFLYLVYQRTIVAPPVFFGPHECGACGKIIYGDECPYCDPRPRRPADEEPAAETPPAPS